MSLILLGILNSQAAGAGGASAYDLLETQVLTSSASSVTFTGLDTLAAGYQHLQLRMTLRNTLGATGSRNLGFRLNGDATAGAYRWHRLRGDGSTVTSGSSTDNNLVWANSSANDLEAAGVFGEAVVDLLDFSSATKTTTFRGLTGVNTSANNYINLYSGLWNNTAAVTSISIIEGNFNWTSGCRFSLYGIKGA